MQIITSRDATQIVIAETETYLIQKWSPDSDLCVVIHKPTKRQFGVSGEENAKRFAQFECWNTGTGQNIELRAYNLGKLASAKHLTSTHLLEYLRYCRKRTNDAAFRHIYDQLKSSFGEDFPNFFEAIEENRSKEIYLP